MKINLSSIFWRFGYIGTVLYKKYSTCIVWKEKWFIFKSFALSFSLFLGAPFNLFIFYFNKKSLSWFLPFSISLSIVYGFWAERFFSNRP